MKKLSMFFILALSTWYASGQTASRQIIASSGGHFGNTSLSIDYTAGESVTDRLSAGNFILTQGFQQPPPGVVSVKEHHQLQVFYELFPNPASDQITLRLKTDKDATLQFSMVDATGKLVTRQVSAQTTDKKLTQSFNIAILAAGNYLLQVSGENTTEHHQIKFTKL